MELLLVRHALPIRREVEEGPAEVIATSPSQPYTQALLDATPVADPEAQAAKRARRRTALERPPRPDADGTTAETDR